MDDNFLPPGDKILDLKETLSNYLTVKKTLEES